MSGRDWYNLTAPWIVLFVGLVVIAITYWVIPYSKGYQAAYQKYQAERTQERASDYHYNKCLTETTIEAALYCYKKAEKTSRDDQRADDDLNAQRQMADWAEGMLWATIAMFIVTSIGVGFVWWTLVVTRRLGESEARAYIWTTGAEISITLPIGGEPKCDIKLMIQNTGKTPAQIAQFSCSVGIVAKEYKGKLDIFKIIDTVLTQPGTGAHYIPADGGTYISPRNKLNGNQVIKFANGDYVAIIMAKIIFDDVFESRFCVEMCLRCEYRNQDDIDIRMYPLHNRPQYMIA